MGIFSVHLNLSIFLIIVAISQNYAYLITFQKYKKVQLQECSDLLMVPTNVKVVLRYSSMESGALSAMITGTY